MNSMILGRYVPGNSVLHRMDPRAKLLGLFLLIYILFWANNGMTNILLFLLASAKLNGVVVRVKMVEKTTIRIKRQKITPALTNPRSVILKK